MEHNSGKIMLTGFSLDEADREIVENMLKNYRHKISERAEFEVFKNHYGLERVTVLSSNLPSLDDHIKIILRSSITPKLIVQLTEFKNHIKTVDFCLFQEVFGSFSKK